MLRLQRPAALAVAIFLATLGTGAKGEGVGFLILTAPRNGKVSWVRLPEDGSFEGLTPETLVDEGLQHPQGVAVDQKRRRLYVADPDARKIYSYQLAVEGNMLRTRGERGTVAQDRESRWVAVDGAGNVFFSDEPENLILKVSAERALRGDGSPEVVYSGSSLAQVNEPGGVAADSFHIYWTNKHFGTEVGSLVRGAELPGIFGPADAVNVLARNVVKSYGVCLALGNVYYTDSERYLYGVKKSGGPVAEVSAALNSPRGCAWDGDGTVYVADRGANAVYSFAGDMHTLARTELKQAFIFEDAFGLAVLTSAAQRPKSLERVVLAFLAIASALLAL